MTAQLCFFLGAATLAVIIGLGGRDRPVSGAQIFLAAIVPVVILIGAFVAGDRFGDFRLRLLGMSVASEALEQPLGVGGGLGDDLSLDGLPPGLAVLRPGPDGRPAWIVDVAARGPRGEAGAVGIVTGESEGGIVGSEALVPGDSICLARCGGEGGVVLRLRGDGGGMERVGHTRPLPSFKARPLISVQGREFWPGRLFWPAEQAIYPLRDYGVPPSLATTLGELCGRRLLCLPNGEPVRSFVYRTCATEQCLRIVLLDPEARLIRGGREVARPRGPTVIPATSEATAVRAYSVLYGSPYADLFVPGRPASRLRARTRLTMTADGGGYRLDLTRPVTVAVPRRAIERAAEQAGDSLAVTIVGGAGVGDAAENPLALQGIGGRLGQRLNARILFSAEDNFGRSATRFRVSELTEPIALGQPFAVGQSSPRRTAELELERHDRPWLAVAIALVWAPLFGHAMGPIWRPNRPAFLIVAVVQWLLALRLLVGVESAALDPALGLETAVGANIAAYVAIPALFAALTPGEAEPRRLWPLLFFAAGVMVLVWWRYGTSTGLVVSCVAILSAVAAIFLRALSRQRAAAGEESESLPEAAPASDEETGPGWWRRNWWWCLILALVAIRIVSLLFGWRERVQWPARFALSIVYVPPLVIAVAGGLRAALDAEPRAGFWRGVGFSLLVALAFGAVPLLVNDNGLIIYLIPVMAATALLAFALPQDDRRGPAWLPRPALRAGRRAAWNLPAIAILGLLAAVLVPALRDAEDWDRRLEAVVAAERQAGTDEDRRAVGAQAAALLAEANSDDRNYLRLWTAFAPGRIAAAGTSDAESQKRVAAILSDYSATRFGLGYMEPSDPGDIRAYQADDNLSAVHIMSPFGRVGAGLVLLVLGLLAWRAGTPSRSDGVWRLAGALALWTIFGTATYMIAANLQWVPFTGRNLYLLAALSASDLIEGSALFLIALRGLGRMD